MRPTVLLLALAAACGPTGPGTVVADLKPKLNEPFTLEVGQTAVFLEPALVIGFTGVPSDSRCPGNLLCFSAGDAVVNLDLSNSIQVDLHTSLQPTSAPWGPYYQIRLVSLEPLRVYEELPGPYRATLIVESH